MSKRPGAGGALLVLLVLLAGVLGIGCRAAAPERVVLGVGAYGARAYVGSLPFWEGPEPYGQGLATAPHAFAVSSGREMKGMVAEIRREGGRVHVAADVLTGAVSADATDGLGNVVYFRRPATAQGDRYDPEHDGLYLVNLRQHAAGRLLDIAAHDQSMSTAVCGHPERFTAWLGAGSGYVERIFSAAAPAGAVTEVQKWRALWCADDDACSSTVLDRGSLPPLLRTACGGQPHEQALEQHWPTSTVVHPRGTMASFSSTDRKSTVVMRLPTTSPRTFLLNGSAYAAAYWDQRTLLVHVAGGAVNQPTHVFVVVVDAERGPLAQWDLDFARSASDRRSLSGLALLPSSGNGRPLVVRLDDDLVLITGTGEVWTWRGDGRATP